MDDKEMSMATEKKTTAKKKRLAMKAQRENKRAMESGSTLRKRKNA